MDRYVIVVAFNLEWDGSSKDYKGLQITKQIYDNLKETSTSKCVSEGSPMPACSLSGKPTPQKWFFALQTCCGSTQFCSADWEELSEGSQKSDSEEAGPSTLEACLSAVEEQEQEETTEQESIKELLEEGADGVHLLADKLPPPGRALLDVILVCMDKEAPPMKLSLPLIGSLKHLQTWHSAKMSMVTEHTQGWQKEATYLMASVCESADVLSCLDERELWRGAVLIREKKLASEVRFDGFSLRRMQPGGSLSSVLPEGNNNHKHTDHQLTAEVFHYYQPALTLLQVVLVADLPAYSLSSTEFQLDLSSSSTRAQMLLDQLATLRGKVAAVFSLSCVVSPMALPSPSQLSTHKWKEFMAKRPKAFTVPEVEVKGETAHYFLLVQGAAEGGCRARMILSANQINGSIALEMANTLMCRNHAESSDSDDSMVEWLRSLPAVRGDELVYQEKCLARVQTLAVKECLRKRKAYQVPYGLPGSHLRSLLTLAREQFFSMQQAYGPCKPKAPPSSATQEPGQDQGHEQQAQGQQGQGNTAKDSVLWPERSVLQNSEKLRRSRQKSRSSLLSCSSDSLLGPKDGQRDVFSSLLDASELLRHFTPDGQPRAPLQPLLLQRGENAFQLTPDLTPRKVSQLPFRKATNSHYHGIEFCLDELGALERDRGMSRLQSRLIRYETHTTCSKEPMPLTPLPFALSPAPSPAVLSEPGSVPDGESLAQGDYPRLKRHHAHSRDPDQLPLPLKRQAKSDSGECPGSHGSNSSGSRGFGPSGPPRALRQQTRPQSSSGALRRGSGGGGDRRGSGGGGDRRGSGGGGGGGGGDGGSRRSGGGGDSSSSRTSSSSGGGTQRGATDAQESTQQPGQGDSQSRGESRSQKHHRMLREVVAKTLKQHGISSQHASFEACNQRLFDISKFYLKDLKTSRGLHEEMKKAASGNAKQVIEWVLEKASKT
ncbi:mdm2-binding protein isoform X2 [Engraulis encrasicolus]|uniref:mdm2-binding protein isoform X2 n=1 Tax=Engraulis encrasicolus TaxID=184585 RepID=UPI002FCF32D4